MYTFALARASVLTTKSKTKSSIEGNMATGASDMVLAIRRARKYSPNSVEKDSAILDSVVGRIAEAGFAVATISEEVCHDIRPRYGICLSMGRNAATLAMLDGQESQGAVVVNASRGVRLCCQRSRLNATLGRAGVPLPPSGMGAKGCWLKRGDGVAETKGDVRFVATPAEMAEAVREMKASGIGDIVAQAHVEGDVVKFYGVRGTGFFRAYYPGDDGRRSLATRSATASPTTTPSTGGGCTPWPKRRARWWSTCMGATA